VTAEQGRPTVSVVIPCYNGEALLPETLRSILGQTRVPDEVIVIDDGSTDRTAAIAAGFGPPVTTLSQENRGESAARNRGIDLARGDWIAFCDADDLWAPTKLEEQLAVATPETIGIATRTLNWQDWEGGHRVVRDEPPEPQWFEYMLETGAPFQISSLVVRRSVSLRFSEATRYGEDLLYLLDLILLGPVVRLEAALTTYRHHPASQSRSNKLVALDWHRGCDEWLQRNRERLGEARFHHGRQLAFKRVTEAAWRAYWQRDWSRLATIRRYAAPLEGIDAVTSLPRQRYPGVLYRAFDWVRGKRPRPAPAA
jgi:glycosyltransferase involved in cell wall biosynthesis